MELVVIYGASSTYRTLLGLPRPAALASCRAILLNKLPQKMELVQIQQNSPLQNAPKALTSEFHPIPSQTVRDFS